VTPVVSRGRTITEADIVAFSGLTGDHHPQHTDAVWAEAGPFGGIVAHGMLVLSYALGLVALDPDRIAALRRIEDVVFKRPVRIGDTIRVEAKVEAVVRGEDGPEAEAEAEPETAADEAGHPVEGEGAVAR